MELISVVKIEEIKSMWNFSVHLWWIVNIRYFTAEGGLWGQVSSWPRNNCTIVWISDLIKLLSDVLRGGIIFCQSKVSHKVAQVGVRVWSKTSRKS